MSYTFSDIINLITELVKTEILYLHDIVNNFFGKKSDNSIIFFFVQNSFLKLLIQ